MKTPTQNIESNLFYARCSHFTFDKTQLNSAMRCDGSKSEKEIYSKQLIHDFIHFLPPSIVIRKANDFLG